MDHTVKWVLTPSESENKQQGIPETDIILALSMLSEKLINVDGKLLSKEKGKYISDSSIHECLVKRKHAKHFSRFLELKSKLPTKSLKRKKSKWDMDDE